MYVHLGEANETKIYLQNKAPDQIYLEEASSIINNYQINNGNISFQTNGFNEGFYRFRNLNPNTTYSIVVTQNGQENTNVKHSAITDKNGMLEFSIPFKGQVTLVINPER